MATDPRSEAVAWGPRSELDVLNRDIPRVDGPDKVTGRAKYSHDMRAPGLLYARLVTWPRVRGTVESIDVSAAQGVPGVIWAAALKEPGDQVLYQGADSVLAAVAAESLEALDDGVRAVRYVVKAEPQLVLTRDAALADGAPVIARQRNATTNVSSLRERGDLSAAEAAFAAAPAQVELIVQLPVQHHVCLETHGQVIVPDERGATVYASSQAVKSEPQGFAQALGLKQREVRVVTQHMGGGFGSKFGGGVEAQVAGRIVQETKRPVHLLLTREQEFSMAGNRSGSWQRVRGGATKDGKLVAMLAEGDRLGGMGGGSLPTHPYIYEVATSWTRNRSVHTSTDPNRAMRAPGHPQASFAMESLVDALAYEVGMDPVEFRKANLPDKAWHRQLDRVAMELGWSTHPNRTAPGKPDARGIARGIGFGVAVWGGGAQDSAKCDVVVFPDGSVESRTATQDLGTGARTYVAAIVAEELGLAVSDVRAVIGDSDLPMNVASGGSVTTGSSAPAIKHAAHLAREALERKLQAVLGKPVGEYTWKAGHVHANGEPRVKLAWRQVAALLQEPLSVTGSFQSNLHEGSIHGAQGAHVEVDTLTGRVKVLKMVGIHDQGLPLNRLALRSQINGGLVQALSYGLLERRVHDESTGFLLTENLNSYLIAGCQEIGEIVALIDDEDERPALCGMAEAAVIPGHSAIANAIFNACGVRLTEMPFTPDNVLNALHGKV
ncbi:MAG: xanthine dehydrogenase family protein molybdopterin-binding subunit [Planctomycetota bacterium]